MRATASARGLSFTSESSDLGRVDARDFLDDLRKRHSSTWNRPGGKVAYGDARAFFTCRDAYDEIVAFFVDETVFGGGARGDHFHDIPFDQTLGVFRVFGLFAYRRFYSLP